MNRGQKNKPFKGKSKGKRKQGGRVNKPVKESGGALTKMGRADRRNASLQKQKMSRKDRHDAHRLGVGGASFPMSTPRLVGVLALGQEHAPRYALGLLGMDMIDEATVAWPVTRTLPAWKTDVTVFPLSWKSGDAPDEVILAGQCVDVLVIVQPVSLSLNEDEEVKLLISALKAQGMPSILLLATSLESIEPMKRRNELKKKIQSQAEFYFPDSLKVLFTDLNSETDCKGASRVLCQCRIRPVAWRDQRSQIFVESIDVSQRSAPHAIVVRLRGRVRKKDMCVNRPFLVEGLGMLWPDCVEVECHRDGTTKQLLPGRTATIQREREKERELSGEVGMAADAESVRRAEELEMKKREMVEALEVVKKVPKGTSGYQSAWIVESDEEVEESHENEEDDTMGDVDDETMEVVEEEGGREKGGEKEEYEWIKLAEGLHHDRKSSMEEEDLDEKKEREEEEFEFPDEVEAPLDQLAKKRFIKYRPLKSFRNTPWNKKAAIPEAYSHIVRFRSFGKTKRRAQHEVDLYDESSMARVGSMVNIIFSLAPNAQWVRPKLCVAFNLLSHETCTSVLHCTVKRHPSYTDPVAAKEEMEVWLGPRRLNVRPIYSDTTFNVDKHKSDRFFHDNVSSMATFYGPVTFPPAPILMYKVENGRKHLVATGTLNAIDPDRVILKKIILTGRPIRVHKSKAIVREMFFFPEDIRWYKTVELRTKHGRVGHILEPLGIHGYMKCVFDGNISQADTIMLALYKRIFPVLPKC